MKQLWEYRALFLSAVRLRHAGKRLDQTKLKDTQLDGWRALEEEAQ